MDPVLIKSTNQTTTDNDPSKLSLPGPALLTNSNQQQQLIILSPIKSSVKLMPNNNNLPTLAQVTRVIASTSNKSTTQTNSIRPNTNVQNSNKNVHYINWFPLSTGNNMNNVNNNKSMPIKTTTNLIKPNIAQKILINPSTIKISTTVASSTSTSQNQSGSSKKANSIWMFPKHILKSNESSLPNKSTTKYIPIAPSPNKSNNQHEVPKLVFTSTNKYLTGNHNHNNTNNNNNNTNNTNTNNNEESRRKACNCTRSQCLKLYCDCFANGEFCNNCNCASCFNNLEHEEIRQKSIRMCLERNPNAFHPKIGQTQKGDVERRHTKGCCCKRSGCLKNYCECYEAKILCSDKCKCIGCKNFEESTERKTLMNLANAAETRSAQLSTSKVHVWQPDFKPKLPVRVKNDCHPFNILTEELLEAITNCLIAQAEEGEFENYSEENIEALVLDQFRQCLSQILSQTNNVENFDGNSDDDTMNDND